VLARSRQVSWLTEADVEQRLRELDSTSWLGASFGGEFSLAGAQAKTALILEDGRWGVPTGSIPTTHILKPAVAGLDDHDLNEHLCLDAPRRAGLLAVRTRVVRFGDESAVVVERYDRRQCGSEIERIHQEDLCQALSVAPSGKYQNQGGPGPTAVARLLRSVMDARAADDAVRRFADASIWNWLSAGTDAHAKNLSLLSARDHVRLAPLHDVASAVPYGTHERKLRLAMRIGGDDGVVPARNTWPGAWRDLGLEAETLRARLLERAAQAPDAFADAANQPDNVALGRPTPSKLVDLVAERAIRCTRVVETTPMA
jgi:serine/threonine-protein kinase HipA